MLFGAAADRAGTRETRLALGEGESVEDVWRALTDRYPELEPMGATLAFAVNQEYASMGDTVEAGDEVAVLPPVSGG